MPDLRGVPHLGRLEGVVLGDDDVDFEHAALVRRPLRTDHGALEVSQVLRVDRLGSDARSLVVLADRLELLQQPPVDVRHGYWWCCRRCRCSLLAGDSNCRSSAVR